MGRKATTTAEPAADNLNHQVLAEDGAALTEVSARSMAVAERFDDGQVYDRGRVMSEARFYAAQAGESMFELGKRLLVLKENEPHGEFLSLAQRSLGLEPRTIQRLMQSAVKYSNPSLLAKASAPTLLGLGKTKLFELMSEADEQLEALAEGGTLAGKTLDEIDAMSSSELRAALRDSRKKIDAKDRVIQSKSNKLDKLQEEAELRAAAPMPEAEAAQVEGLRFATQEAESALLRLLATVDDVINAPATEAAEKCAGHSVEYLVQRLVDGCLERGITVDLAERVSPIWAQAIDDAVDAAKPRRGRKG